jgi:hypothetical protein
LRVAGVVAVGRGNVGMAVQAEQITNDDEPRGKWLYQAEGTKIAVGGIPGQIEPPMSTVPSASPRPRPPIMVMPGGSPGERRP